MGVEEPQSATAATTRPRRRGLFPTGVVDLATPSLKFGAWSGAGGVVIGVAGAIRKDFNPYLNGASQGIAFSIAGTSYWFTRTVVMRNLGGEADVKPFHKTLVSAMAGSTSGALFGLLRGPQFIIPSTIVWAVIGGTGQGVANRIAAYEPKVKDENDSWFRSKWSPLQKLTDQEYIDMMEQKKFKVDVDIALIDDRIAELRAAHSDVKTRDERIDKPPK